MALSTPLPPEQVSCSIQRTLAVDQLGNPVGAAASSSGGVGTTLPGQPAVTTSPTTLSLTSTGQTQFGVQGGQTYALTLTNAPGATSTWVGTVAFEWSADGATWNALTVKPKGTIATGASVTQSTTVGLWLAAMPVTAQYFRYNVTAYTSGTIWMYCDPWGQPNVVIAIPFTPTVTSGQTLVGPIETSGLSEFTVHVSAATTTQLTVQGSNDPTFTAVFTIQTQDYNSTTSGGSGALAYVNPFRFTPHSFKWVRVQCTTTGTVLTIQGVTAVAGIRNMITAQGNSAAVNVVNSPNIGTVAPGTGATNLGKGEDNAAATGDVGVFVLGVRRDALAISASATGDYNEMAVDRFGSQINRSFEKTARSFNAAANVTPAATPTDVADLFGNASTTVVITAITVKGVQTTGGMPEIIVAKRSTANSAGTRTAMTAVPLDATDTAASSIPGTYTANPTTGTLVGNLRREYVPIPAAAAPIGNAGTRFEFGDKGKGITLSGTAQGVSVNLNGVTLTGGVLDVEFEWYEY
jgi:hypothetical protein